MRYGRISDLIRRSAGALLLLGSLGVSSDRLFAEDANCATPAPACTPQCSDDVYKRAGERLAQQLQQMGGQPCGQGQCTSGCDTVAPGCMSDGCTKGSCLFGGLFSHGDGCAEEKKDPWTLMSVFDDECGNNWLKDNGLTIGGWLAMGYSTDPDGAFTGNGAALNQREHNNLNINQLYMYVARVADGSKGFDWGFRADLIYGVDGNDTQSFGNRAGKFDFLNGWGGPGDPNTHGPYEWAMPQLYAEVAMGDLSVKAGHFYTPIGYEVVTTPDNFFFSKQLTFYNSEPFTHTGALATYKVNDKLTVIGGWTLGWDTGFDQNMKGSNAIFGATYAASETTTLVYAAAVGEFGVRGNGAINSFILSQKWGEKLMTVHQFDVLNTNNPVDFTAGGTAGESTGLINYVFYQLTDKAKAGARYEWYKADGTSHNTFTYGVNYQLTPNIVVRPEVRHNWAPGNDVSPFNEDIFGVDAVLRF